MANTIEVLFELHREKLRASAKVKEPGAGWEAAFRLLLVGICPYCGSQFRSPGVNDAYGLSWDCNNGCNP